MNESGHPMDVRWADPDGGESIGQRELIIAIINVAGEVGRMADALERLERRES